MARICGYDWSMPSDPNTRFSLSQIVIDGLGPDTRAAAEQEIRNQCELIQHVAPSLQQNVVLSVHLADDLAASVDRFRASQSEHGDPYDRSRIHGTSFGIVLPSTSESSAAAYTIIADASMWSEQSSVHVVHRTYGLARLLATIVRDHDASRPHAEPPSISGRHAQAVWHAACALRSTWEDFCFSLDICASSLRDQNGGRVNVVDYLGDSLIAGVSEMLDMLCVFDTFDIELYRALSIGSVDDLYETGPRLAATLLQLLVETIAVFGAASRFRECCERVSRLHGFVEFVDPVWDDIIDACTAEQAEDMLARFDTILTDVLSRMGLRIEDREDGSVYVHVHDPVVCTWNEVAASTS